MWFIGVEVEQETSAPPPKKNPGSAPVNCHYLVNSDHKELKSILTAFGLKQLSKDPTRVTQDSRSLIDVIYTNEPWNIYSVIPAGLSDHDLVCCTHTTSNINPS